jgi:CHAT domain-containing protein
MIEGKTKMTDTVRGFRARLVTAAAMSALLTAGCATTAPLSTGSNLALGENAAGDPCEASVNWSDESFGDAFAKEARSYSVGCRGRNASGTLARVRIFETGFERDAFTSTLSCTSETSIALADFSDTTARRCIDPALGLDAFVINTEAGGRFFQLSSATNAVGPGVQALRLLAGIDTPGSVTSDRSIAGLASIPAAPSDGSVASSGSNLNLDEAISSATRQIFLGNFANASNLLKSALAQVDDNTPAGVEADLLLEAALADSNIEFFESAKTRFSQAEDLLRSPNVARASILARKLAIYRGLDALNQRNFKDAKDRLSPIIAGQVSGDQPLQDPVGLSVLNSTLGSGDVRNSLNIPNEEQSRELILTSQAHWALSVASYRENDLGLSRQSLEEARKTLSTIKGIERSGFLWLEARLDRQLGRILEEQRDFAGALEAFNRAEEKLIQSSLAGIGTGAEPAIAELALERASLLEKSGASASDIDSAYAGAVTALVNARGQQATFRTSPLEPYLNRLLDQSAAGDQAALSNYFQALQVTSESGAARQISQLQAQVSSDSEVGELISRHSDAQRELNEIEFQIRRAGAADQELQSQRTALLQNFVELDAQLQSEGRVNRIADRPADLSELQGTLGEGEVYVKLTIIGDSIYGLLIEEDGATPYRVNAPASTIRPLLADIRYSIDGTRDTTGRLSSFNLTFASLAYAALFGKVDEQLDGRSSIVVDGGETLRALTPAVLVTDRTARAKPVEGSERLDYSEVPFMIQKAPISIASSPSSFIASKRLGASRASQPLIGFADPRPLADAASVNSNTSVGPCALKPADLVDLSARYAPISRREVDIAANALGVSDVQVISGEQFTDQNLLELGKQNGTLGGYKVLHFATHGASEGQFGCDDSPSALLTSLGSGGSDMLLSFDEIPDLKLDANLVVLSACETESVLGEESLQRVGLKPGETLAGLVKAFFSANARAVMATYWEASAAEDSEIFFDTFYSSGRTKSIASSLQDAQTELIKTAEYSHPFYWGPFFVIGNTSNGMLAQGSGNLAQGEAETPKQIAALTD